MTNQENKPSKTTMYTTFSRDTSLRAPMRGLLYAITNGDHTGKPGQLNELVERLGRHWDMTHNEVIAILRANQLMQK